MKQTYQKIVSAFNALKTIRDEKTSNETARKLYNLKKKIEEPYQFYCDREEQLAHESGGTVNGNSVLFENGQDKQKNEFILKVMDLNSMETEIDWECCQIKEEIPISYGAIEDLSGFIEFTGNTDS